MMTGAWVRRERRRHSRYPATWELTGKMLPPAGAVKTVTPGRRAHFRGQVADISPGGLCVVSRDRPDPSAAMRGEIFNPHIPAGIPTLLQVRWVDESPDGYSFRIGLQFLVCLQFFM